MIQYQCNGGKSLHTRGIARFLIDDSFTVKEIIQTFYEF